MSFNLSSLLVLATFAALTLTAYADTRLKRAHPVITAKHHLSWKDAGAPARGSRIVSFPLIQGNSQEVLHPKKETDDSPKPPEFVQKIRDNMAYKVKDW